MLGSSCFSEPVVALRTIRKLLLACLVDTLQYTAGEASDFSADVNISNVSRDVLQLQRDRHDCLRIDSNIVADKFISTC